MEITDLETPALLVEEPVLRRNIENMQKYANEQGFLLYPHFKTHKCLKIVEMQIMNGAKGITVSSLSEAELLLDHGINDILIAYPIVGSKIEKLYQLFKRSGNKLSCIVDNAGVAKDISDKFSSENEVLEVFMKIDVGLHRCGVLPFSERSTNLAKIITESSGLQLKGLLSHAGHAYKASSIQQIQAIAQQEMTTLENIANGLEVPDGNLEFLSVGATPTAKYYQAVGYQVVFRPGNYVFYDLTQVSLGSASMEDCSLTVLATVISNPTEDRIIIDAGAKTLSLHPHPAKSEIIIGYGGILKKLFRKQINNSLVLEHLSEEHGIIHLESHVDLRVGDKIRIVPNHACMVTNLHDYCYFVQGEIVLEKVPIEARGKSV